MKKWIVLMLLCWACFLTGCAKYYYQEGKTFNQCAWDRADCLFELKKRQAVQSEGWGDYEHKFLENCMESRGYRLVTEDKLPLDVKREDPDTTLRGYLYGQRRGIAGALDEK
jgi:hypothetical protein